MHPTHNLEFRAPDPSRLNVDAVLARVPSTATVKGLFMETLLQDIDSSEREQLLARAGITFRRYTTFYDYPYSDLLRLERVLAQRAHPELAEGEGIRKLCSAFYEAFAQTMAGRVVFGVLGRNARRIMPLGPKGWKICVGMGRVESEVVGDTHVRYHFHDYPGLIEAADVGVVEGALGFCRVQGTIAIAEIREGDAVLDIRWT